jgi:hypothetical protein
MTASRLRTTAWWVLVSAISALAQDHGGLTPLPEGNNGLAAKYPADAGIGKDPAVVFHDDFESAVKPSDLPAKWDAGVFHEETIRIAVEPENVHAGKRALEFRVPQQEKEWSNSVARKIKDEKEVLFLRSYTKFEKGFDQVGSSHNGSTICAHDFVNGNATPGVPADGKNKFLACLENWRGEKETASPGRWNVYCYHPEQKDRWGDHFFPSGEVLPNSSERSGERTFGKGFAARKDATPELDRWFCHEFMVKANTPGERDGRIAFWIDGKLTADFPNLRLRDVPELKIDRFALDLHIGRNTARENRKWYDDVVAATSYIGPMENKPGR